MKLIIFLQAFLTATVILFYPAFWLETAVLLGTFWAGYLANDVYGKQETELDAEEEDEEFF